MPSKILVALDGTRTSESVLPYLESLLRYQDADVTLATARPAGKPLENMEAQAYLRTVAERLARMGAVVRVEVLTGSPADALAAYAAGGRFDLLALCSKKSRLARRLLGSVAEGLLRTATTPVLVVPPLEEGRTPAALKKIVVPLDGSHRSAEILKPVKALARAFGAKLCLVHVVNPAKKDELPLEVVAHNVFGSQKALRKDGLDAEVAVLYGEPVERILAFAEENQADLIGLATHGRAGLAKLFFGNVAESLLRGSRRAMLVLRTAAVPGTRATSSRALRARHRSLEAAAMGIETKSPYHG